LRRPDSKIEETSSTQIDSSKRTTNRKGRPHKLPTKLAIEKKKSIIIGDGSDHDADDITSPIDTNLNHVSREPTRKRRRY